MDKMGTKTQVRTVHITINLNVTDILPMAFNIFVKGVVTAANADVAEMRVSAKSAGFHLLYFGITSVNDGTSNTNNTSVGKVSKQIKKMAFETVSDNSFLLSCNLENAGNVTLMT